MLATAARRGDATTSTKEDPDSNCRKQRRSEKEREREKNKQRADQQNTTAAGEGDRSDLVDRKDYRSGGERGGGRRRRRRRRMGGGEGRDEVRGEEVEEKKIPDPWVGRAGPCGQAWEGCC